MTGVTSGPSQKVCIATGIQVQHAMMEVDRDAT